MSIQFPTSHSHHPKRTYTIHSMVQHKGKKRRPTKPRSTRGKARKTATRKKATKRRQPRAVKKAKAPAKRKRRARGEHMGRADGVIDALKGSYDMARGAIGDFYDKHGASLLRAGLLTAGLAVGAQAAAGTLDPTLRYLAEQGQKERPRNPHAYPSPYNYAQQDLLGWLSKHPGIIHGRNGTMHFLSP